MASIVTGLIEQVKIDAGANQSIASTAYGVCNTLSDQAAKTVEMTGFKLITGVTVHIKFTYSNAAENPPTLNINNTGAKSIVQYGTTSAGTNAETNGWQAGAVLSLTYDGTSWVRDQGYNTNTNTWRGIQDNLTSDSATDSLSAKQGKALKGLIDAMDATTPNASGNATAFIDSITQTDGKITSITKKNIPTVSKDTAGLAPKGAAVSTQSQSTKFLREDGSWAAPSYTTNTDAKVAQTGNTENKEFSILLKGTNDTADKTEGVKYGKTTDKLVTVNPSTGRITAPGGLAGVADSANAVAWGNVSSKPTSIKLTGAVTGSVTLGSGENSITTTVNHTHAYLSSIAWDNSNKKITQSVNGAAATAILEFVAGSNITLTPAAGKLTIANSYSYTLPIALYNKLGGLKPAYTSTAAATLTTAAATNTDTPTIVAKTTTSGRYYAVEADKNGIAYVNVPWTDHYAWGDITGKPTKITLTGAVTGSISLGAGDLSLATTVNHNHDSTYSYIHLTDYSFTATRPLSKYVTFDKSNPDGAPTATWYNGFISSHNNYLASYIINAHRTDNWYVGYGQFDTSTNTAPAPTWYKLAHSGNVSTGDNNGQVKIAGQNVSVKGLKALAYKDSLTYSDVGAAASNHNHNGTYVPNTTGANDVNTLYNTGIYNITSGSLTNGPVGYGYGQLLVMSYRKHTGNTTTDWATQIYAHLGSGNNGNTLYFRTSNASTWQTWQMVAHANAGTARGDTKKPIYINAKGEIQEGDTLKNLAYKDSLIASDIPNLSWNKITSDKPTTLSGYGITDAKIASGVITLGSNTITPVTSVNGHTGSSVSVTADDLGLSKAMRFIGVATVDITDGSTTDPVISGYNTKTAGDVIIDKDSSREYVWSTTGNWELLGGDSSYKTTQSAVDSGAVATNKWVSRIQQNANGVVTATMGTLDTSGTWTGTATKATTTVSTDAMYLVGVKSGATSTLLHDTSISITKGKITIGARETTTQPSSETAIDRIIITPYFHTGGPWKITSADDGTNAFLKLFYGLSELIKIKHDGTFINTLKASINGNAATATSGKYLMNRGASTVSIGDSSWAVQKTPSGQTNRETVWHQKWAQSGITYTPSGGSATAISDTADLKFWLSSSNTSNILQLNMQIDGIIYAASGFYGNLIGQADTVARATFGNSSAGEHNANNIKSNGLWYYTSNGPATTLGASTTDGAIYSQAYSTSWVGQIAQDYRDGALFVRGLNNGTWKNWYAIPKFTTTTGGLGSTTQPVYINTNGEVVAGTALKALAYKDSLTYSDVGAAPSSTISCTTANVESALGIDFITHAGALNTNGWKTLGGRTSGAKIAIAYNNNAAAWNSGKYSASLVFGCADTRGLLDCRYDSPTVTFGGASNANSTDDAPNWYFKLSGTSGQTYTFPSASKTLAATDGTGASGTWGISISGNAATATKATQDSDGNTISSTYLKLSGGTMTGQIVLCTTGFRTNADSGYRLDTSGNFIHLRNTTTDTFNFCNSAGTGKVKIYWETGNVTAVGTVTATGFSGPLTGNVTGNADTATRLTAPDTRSIDESPSTLMGWGRGVTSAFKSRSTIGSPNGSGTYGIILNLTPWGDSSGSRPKQLWIDDSSMSIRHSTSDSAWSSWSQFITNSGTWGISITGNAATATTLQTARAINGTNFDGSANITTANWGTTRAITVGATSKNVNGSAAVSWTKAEILGTGTTGQFYRGDNSWSDTISGGTLKITNNSNTVTIGSQNTSFTHIYNSANIPFIFNQDVLTTGSHNLGSVSWPWGNLYIGAKGSRSIYYVGTKATNAMITFLDNTSDAYGNGIKIGGGGAVVVGAGESAGNLSVTAGTETLYLVSDSVINIEAGGDTIANRIGFQITAAGHIVPVKAEAVNNNAQNLGASDNKWANVYATNFVGNASTATKATQDSDGNAINSTYFKLTETRAATTSNTFSITNATASTSTTTGALKVKGGVGVEGNIYANQVYNAVWNDYAEYRKCDELAPGMCVQENDDGKLTASNHRLIPACSIITDTFGFSEGKTDDAKTPVAVAGRVLAYTYLPRHMYHAGMAVCSAPGGTIDIMTREEIRDYPDCIIGYVSEIPDYEEWGSGNVKVNGRIWIKVK